MTAHSKVMEKILLTPLHGSRPYENSQSIPFWVEQETDSQIWLSNGALTKGLRFEVMVEKYKETQKMVKLEKWKLNGWDDDVMPTKEVQLFRITRNVPNDWHPGMEPPLQVVGTKGEIEEGKRKKGE